MHSFKKILRLPFVLKLLAFLVIFGACSRVGLSQSLTKIPAELRPENGVFSFERWGNELNLLINPLDVSKLKANKAIKISFRMATIHFDITKKDKRIRGVLRNTDKTQTSEVFFVKNWSILLKNMPIEKNNSIEVFIKSDKDIDLFKVEKNSPENTSPAPKKPKTKYLLPESDKFTIEIHANKIEAELLLPSNSSPQNNNPIKLIQKRAPAGGQIEYKLREETVIGKASKITVLFFSEETQKTLKVVSMDVDPKKNMQGLWGTVILPKCVDFGRKWWIKTKPIKAALLVTDEEGNSFLKIDELYVTWKGLGIIGGVLVVIIFLIIVRLAKKVPLFYKGEKMKWIKASFRFPLHFALTPLRRYSISLAQILIWTLITIFASMYVSITRGEFLTITEQILILLGISGTTAIASKAAAMARVRDIPPEYMIGIEKDRFPAFRDLFSIGDVPNIFKFQIFAFTILAGVYVIQELLKFGNFPTLEENLLTLMGISGGAYVANELATENIWDKLDNWIKDNDKKKKELFKLNKETEIIQLDSEHKELNKELEELKEKLKKRKGPIPTNDPDKKREGNLESRKDEIERKLAYRDKLKEEVDALDEQIKTELMKIYTETGLATIETKAASDAPAD